MFATAADPVSSVRPVGAQVATASFVMFYLTEKNTYSKERAAQLFSFMQITFMVARFISTPLLRFFDPATVLFFYGLGCTVFTLVAALTGGTAGLASLFLVFFFESVCYPTVFTLGTR
jgi:FHS family L-fucose permease-like MFS transporter